MNKQDLIESIAKRAAISKKSAALALDAMLSYVATMPEKKSSKVVKSAKRSASKPRTSVALKAAKSPKFKPGKALKDTIK